MSISLHTYSTNRVVTSPFIIIIAIPIFKSFNSSIASSCGSVRWTAPSFKSPHRPLTPVVATPSHAPPAHTHTPSPPPNHTFKNHIPPIGKKSMIYWVERTHGKMLIRHRQSVRHVVIMRLTFYKCKLGVPMNQ